MNKDEFVTLPSSIPHGKTTVKAKLTGKEKFVLNDQLYILGYEGSKTCQTQIIVGDRVSKVNRIQMKTKAQATAPLAVPGEFTLELLRRKQTQTLSKIRWDKVKLNGEDGYGYFLVACVKLVSDIGHAMGFSLNVKKNRAFVTAVEPNSIASRHFAVGDAFADLDSVPIPDGGDAKFIRSFWRKLNNSCELLNIEQRAPAIVSMVLKTLKLRFCKERAVSLEAREKANSEMKFLISTAKSDLDVEMSADAVAIGKQVALTHQMVLSKLTPVGAFKEPRTQESTKETVEDEINNNKRVNIENPKILVTTIGSDVDEDDSLRPVKPMPRVSSCTNCNDETE